MHDSRCPVQVLHPHTLPLHAIDQDGHCHCGKPACSAPGKHPKTWGNPEENGGYGIRCGAISNGGSGIFVVDCDEKPGLSGLVEFWKLCEANGMTSLPNTLMVETGGGGFHLYFLHPGGPGVKNSVCKLGPGIDIRGEGGWVVGPGSPHVSGRGYVVKHDAPIAEAPQWLLDWPGLWKDPPTTDGGPGPDGEGGDDLAFAPVPLAHDDPRILQRMVSFRSECEGYSGNIRPAISGERGHDRLYHAAKRGTCYFLLPQDVVVAILLEYYNPRCSPPWEPHDVERKVYESIRTNREPTPGPPPEDFGQSLVRRAILGDAARPFEPQKKNPGHRYKYAIGESVSAGKIYPRSKSEILVRLSRHEEWSGVFQWDEFSNRVLAINPPIRLDCEEGKGLTKRDLLAISIALEVGADIQASKETIEDCVEGAAQECRVHPVREYLRDLPSMTDAHAPFVGLSRKWFGTPEEDAPLYDELLKRFLVGAVRRICMPGTQMDQMLVLHGEQGCGKTQWINALFGAEWTTHQMPSLDKDSDASDQVASKWAVEFAELDKLLRVDPRTCKDFISRQWDHYRAAYGRIRMEKPRQCVFIGTTNDDAFLRDPTGERRYHTIPVRQRVPLDLVRSMRDVVWAAARDLASTAFEHHVEPGSELDALLVKVQAQFADADPLEDEILDYCAGREFVAPKDLFRDVVMRGDLDWASKYVKREQIRMGAELKRIGGKKDSRWDPSAKKKVKCYVMPLRVRDMEPSHAEAARRKQTEKLAKVSAN